jgi:HEPN domain-containing protein
MTLTPTQEKEIVEYWASLAQYDVESGQAMFAAGRYPYALFMYHSALEKFLKALCVQTSHAHADYTHDLLRLSESLPAIHFSSEQNTLLTEVNEFNIRTRYPEWNREFYKTATIEFTEKYMHEMYSLYVWLHTFLQK